MSKESACHFQKRFDQQVFRNVPFSRYLENNILRADPVTPFRDRLQKNYGYLSLNT